MAGGRCLVDIPKGDTEDAETVPFCLPIVLKMKTWGWEASNCSQPSPHHGWPLWEEDVPTVLEHEGGRGTFGQFALILEYYVQPSAKNPWLLKDIDPTCALCLCSS